MSKRKNTTSSERAKVVSRSDSSDFIMAPIKNSTFSARRNVKHSSSSRQTKKRRIAPVYKPALYLSAPKKASPPKNFIFFKDMNPEYYDDLYISSSELNEHLKEEEEKKEREKKGCNIMGGGYNKHRKSKRRKIKTPRFRL